MSTNSEHDLVICAQCAALTAPEHVYLMRCRNCHIGDRLREDASLPPWPDTVKFQHANKFSPELLAKVDTDIKQHLILVNIYAARAVDVASLSQHYKVKECLDKMTSEIKIVAGLYDFKNLKGDM